MKQPRAPGLDARRTGDFDKELTERARAWIPGWAMDGDPLDFGRALMKVAARYASEVAERLDRAGDKMRLGFLDWLAVQGEAARPARLPVVFKLGDSARTPVLAPQGTRLQVEVEGSPVILETEKGVNVLPRQLKLLVAVDADNDKFYLAPAGLQSLAPLEHAPTQWRLKSFASTGAKKLQLDPETGLTEGMFIEVGGQQYTIGAPAKDIVTIDPRLSADQPERALVTKVAAFLPFDGAARNRQEHVLYLGHEQLFDIESEATIEILGAQSLGPEVTWEYYGKDVDKPDDEPDWLELTLPEIKVQEKSAGLVRLKRRGKVELFEVMKGRKTRWIRARIVAVAGSDPLLRVDKLDVRVNCDSPQPPTATPPVAEAMANTTPLVLDSVFFPFGKEPRQFDAFYLGSTEAFSKKEAHVTLKFDMADTTFPALSALRVGGVAEEMLAGVARDGSLYVLGITAGDGKISRLKDRGPVRPPPRGADAGSADVSAGVPLTRPLGRVPIWQDGTDPNVRRIAASAGSAVWIRLEHTSNATLSRWQALGVPVISSANDAAPVDDLIYFADTKILFALRGGQLSKYMDSLSTWEAVKRPEEKVGGKSVPVELQAIVPVLVPSSGSLATSAAAGMIGISKAGRLYSVQVDGKCEALKPEDLEPGVRPVAVRSGDLFVAFAGDGEKRKPMLFQRPMPAVKAKPGDIFEVNCAEEEAAVLGFDTTLSGVQVNFLASIQFASTGYLLTWEVPAAANPIEPFRADVPAGRAQPAGAPVVVAGHAVVPADRGRVLSTKLDLTQRPELEGDVSEVVIAPGLPILAEGDVLVREVRPVSPGDAEKLVVRKVNAFGSTTDTPAGEAFYVLKKPFGKAADGSLHAFKVDSKRTAKREAEANKLKLPDDDDTTKKGSLILAKRVAYRVTALTSRIATLEPSPPDGPSDVDYHSETEFSGRVSPSLSLDAANSIDRAKLAQATFFFKTTKQRQKGKPLHGGNKVDVVELILPWSAGAIPAKGVEFVLDAAVGEWHEFLQDTSTNPELSWEYWNGTGWWKLIVTNDETARLKVSGNLQFTVPTDIAPTDWSGRTNYWIRARLVGGDYGREEVSIESSGTFGTDDFVQTVVRSTENIHAPSVAKLTISYSVCKAVLPTFVLTQDSGTKRDQSDANRTGGAMVEAFVPISALLRGFTAAGAQPETVGPCALGCDGVLRSSPAVSAGDAAERAAGRALYLGFDAALTGASVNVLLLVQEERRNDDFAPMAIETLIADRFVPIVAHDATRALGESGILSLAFTLAPTQCELFGQTLTWLRLTPRPGSNSVNWKPTVLGAYLNAAWANATETLTYELVGSSQGEPNLTLPLARPPVLKDTLELRVREPLGEEELVILNAARGDRVLSAVENLPGHWVLWDRVTDPDDELPDRRVYAFDEGTAEIRFGDGKHGRIPPVGRDSIMAFKYQRTERGRPGSTDVPANSITARMPLNLVSPIETVEAVFAADQAAGGAPAEDTGRVLRFGVAGLRHRRRAVTPADLEDIALQSSPRIAQARCFPGKGFVQLIVVMRGADPQPSAAQVRELRSHLQSRASPSLSAQDALRIAGPKVRRLRVDLRLRVTSLDDAGEVAQATKRALIALFDTLTGGPDGDGWALGENPAEADIALALAAVPRLEGIASVTLREIAQHRSEHAWPAALKRHELAMPDDDVMRVEFETVEAIA